jgi:hypothetical protein
MHRAQSDNRITGHFSIVASAGNELHVTLVARRFLENLSNSALFTMRPTCSMPYNVYSRNVVLKKTTVHPFLFCICYWQGEKKGSKFPTSLPGSNPLSSTYGDTVTHWRVYFSEYTPFSYLVKRKACNKVLYTPAFHIRFRRVCELCGTHATVRHLFTATGRKWIHPAD